MAGSYNISVEQGETFDLGMTYKDSTGTLIDLTGYTAKMEVRAGTFEKPEGSVLSLTTVNGRIILGDDAGTIRLLVDATTVDTVRSGHYVYDLFLTSSGGTATRLLVGKFDVVQKVTQG